MGPLTELTNEALRGIVSDPYEKFYEEYFRRKKRDSRRGKIWVRFMKSMTEY